MSPNTKNLDHIVHLTPPGTVQQASKQFQELGFQVLPGGTHAGGLSENALVIFADGVYLELISFTHPASHYPSGSPERARRDSNPWAALSPGWIDFAFLGNGPRFESISHFINERGREEGSGVQYETEMEGGRTRPDGEVLKWLISAPQVERQGVLPFFCGDVTPRTIRVPTEPPDSTKHPPTASGIAFVRILIEEKSFVQVSKQITSVVGTSPISLTANESIWELDVPYGAGSLEPVSLVLAIPTTEAETVFLATASVNGSGIYEIGFRVQNKSGSDTTPYGKLTWVGS